MLLAASIAGCNLQQSASDFEVAVPVLWASGTDANSASGIESATVAVGQDSVPGFSVDMTDPTAEGVGPQWRAASGMAAAVGSLYSGVDPATVSVRFTVTGPIDGLSGGAMLTVGVIAALSGEQVLPRTTMTGALLPDGQIESVGAIPNKIRAAAEDDFETVLIPQANLMASPTQDGAPADMVAFGRDLGVTVVPVTDLVQAYQLLVGTELLKPAQMPDLSAAAQQQSRLLTTAMLDRSVALKKKSGAGLSPGQVARVDASLGRARVALKAGQVPATYALASTTYRELLEFASEQRTRAAIRSQGLGRVKSDVASRAQRVITETETTANALANTAGLPGSQQLMMALALTQLPIAQVTAARVNEVMTSPAADATAVVSAGLRSIKRVRPARSLCRIVPRSSPLVPNWGRAVLRSSTTCPVTQISSPKPGTPTLSSSASLLRTVQDQLLPMMRPQSRANSSAKPRLFRQTRRIWATKPGR